MSKAYMEAAGVLEKVLAKRGSVRGLCFGVGNSSRNPRSAKSCFALVTETLKHLRELREAVRRVPEISTARESLVLVMAHDLLYRGKISGGGGSVKRLLTEHQASLRDAIAGCIGSANDLEVDPGRACQYARVNSLLVGDLEEVLGKLGGGAELDEHLGERCWVVRLGQESAGTLTRDHELVKSRKVIVQSKPSCMPAAVLSPSEGSVVIDACAAPGNKTSLLSALMRNTGRVFAFDRDEKRLSQMKELLAASGATNVTARHEDWLKVDPAEPCFKGVEYILVDPSCSGSGLLDRPEEEKVDEVRLRKLAAFQTRAVVHAFEFGARRVVYSTCSVNAEENEQVVARALQSGPGSSYHLVEALPSWPRRGDESVVEGGRLCLRVDPKLDGMTGFFVSCFERTVGEEEKEADAPPAKRSRPLLVFTERAAPS